MSCLLFQLFIFPLQKVENKFAGNGVVEIKLNTISNPCNLNRTSFKIFQVLFQKSRYVSFSTNASSQIKGNEQRFEPKEHKGKFGMIWLQLAVVGGNESGRSFYNTNLIKSFPSLSMASLCFQERVQTPEQRLRCLSSLMTCLFSLFKPLQD